MEIKNFLYNNIDTVVRIREHRPSKFPSECYYDIPIFYTNKEELESQLKKFVVGKIIGVEFDNYFSIREIASIEYKKCVGDDGYRNYDMVSLKVRQIA